MSKHELFGTPSGKKQAARRKGWLAWARGMAMLRQIHEETREERANIRAFDDKMNFSKC